MIKLPRFAFTCVCLFVAVNTFGQELAIPTPYNGEWKMGGSVVTIVQQGTNVTATFKTVSGTTLYAAGETAFSGTLTGTKLNGKFELRQVAEDGGRATMQTPIELTLVPGGSKIQGRFEDRQFNKSKGEWTDKTRWINLVLTREEIAKPRFVTKNENLGIDLRYDAGTFTEVSSISEGVPVWVELQFETAPEGPTRTVAVAGASGERQVIVTRAGDEGRLYRSATPLMFEQQIELPHTPANQPRPAAPKISTYERTPIDWMHGNWRVSYFDQSLGTVYGSASVAPSRDGLVRIDMMLRHPENEDLRYHLRSTESKIQGDQLIVTLDDASPSAARMITGHDHAVAVRDADPMFVVVGSTEGATATYGKNEAKIAFAEQKPTDANREIELMFDLNKDAKELLPSWSIAFDPKTGFIGRRHGRINHEKVTMTGLETWTRLDIVIDKVTSLEDLDNAEWRSAAGMVFDDQKIKSIWLRLEGEGLKFDSTEDLQVIFDDKMITYHKQHRPDPEVADAWNIEIDLDRGVVTGEKTFTVNEAPATWLFDPKGLDPTVTFVRQVMVNEFREAQELYGGEMFQVQAKYKTKPFFEERDIQLMVNKNIVQSLTLKRSKDASNVFHSQSLLLPGNPAAYEAVFGDAIGAAVDVPPDAITLAAKKGDVLVARFAPLPDRPTKQQEIGVARVLGMPSNDWIKALEKAEDCYKNSNNPLKTKTPKGYAFTNVILTSFGTRKVQMTLRDHAALLLVRDFAIGALESKVREMNQEDPISKIADLAKREEALKRQGVSQAQFAEALIGAAGKNASHPLFALKVSNPQGTSTLKLNAALEPDYLNAQFGDDHGEQIKYARRSISEAEGKMLGYASQSLDRLRNTADCDVDKLMRTCGMGFGCTAELVKDKLLIPANDESGRLVPDRAGYASIDKIASLYNTVKSQEEYARADTDLVVFLATAPFLFASVSANVVQGTLAASSYATTIASVSGGALIAADLVETGILYADSKQYANMRDEEIGFRKGLISLEGSAAVTEVEAEANALYWQTVIGGSAMAGGTAAGEVLGAVTKRLAKANLEALEEAVVVASRRGVDQLTTKQVRALAEVGLLKVMREAPGTQAADAVLAALAEHKELIRRGASAAEEGAEAVASSNTKSASAAGESLTDTVKVDMPAFDDLTKTTRSPGAGDEFADTVRMDGPDVEDFTKTTRTPGAGDELADTVRMDGPDVEDLTKTTRSPGAGDEFADTVRMDGPDVEDLTKTTRSPAAAGDNLTDTAKLDMPEFNDLTKSTKTTPAAEVSPPAARAKGPTRPWKAPDGKTYQIGEKLGEGQYSDVYRLGGDREGQVLKMAKVTDDITPARAAEKVLEAKDISDLLEANGIPQTKVVDIHADPNGQSYTITEILPEDASMVDHLKLEADRASLIESGKWTADHEHAVFELYDAMASKNLIWLDGHLDNVYFVPGPNGKLKAGILDHDMIAKFDAIPDNLDERLGNAFAFAGEEGIDSMTNMPLGQRARFMPKNAHEAMALMLEHKRLIGFKNGKFIPKRLDPSGLDAFEGFKPYINAGNVASDGLLKKLPPGGSALPMRWRLIPGPKRRAA